MEKIANQMSGCRRTGDWRVMINFFQVEISWDCSAGRHTVRLAIPRTAIATAVMTDGSHPAAFADDVSRRN